MKRLRGQRRSMSDDALVDVEGAPPSYFRINDVEHGVLIDIEQLDVDCDADEQCPRSLLLQTTVSKGLTVSGLICV